MDWGRKTDAMVVNESSTSCFCDGKPMNLDVSFYVLPNSNHSHQGIVPFSSS